MNPILLTALAVFAIAFLTVPAGAIWFLIRQHQEPKP